VITAVNAASVDSRVHADVGFPPCGASGDEPSNIARAAASNHIARAARPKKQRGEKHHWPKGPWLAVTARGVL